MPDVRRLLAGNWLGAGITAVTALGIAAVLSGAMALMAKPIDFGLWNTLTLAMVIMAGSFGADLTATIESADIRADAYLGVFPLTVTIASMAGAVWAFRRITANYPKPAPAIGDAFRAALIFAVPLFVGSLIFDADNDNLGRGWGRELSERQLEVQADFGPNPVEALVLGFLIMAATLAVTAMLPSRGWPERVRRVHDWVAAPFYGIGAMLSLLPLTGILGFLLLGFDNTFVNENEPADDPWALAAVVFGGLATGGAWLIAIGAGASAGGSSQVTGEKSSSEWQHLWGSITSDEPGLWAAPVVMFAVLGVSAYAVARHSPSKDKVLGNLAVWVALTFLTVPLLVRLAGVHAGARVTFSAAGDDNEAASIFFGLHGVQSTFFLALAAAVAATVVAMLTGALDAAKVRARTGAFARSIQTNPGATTEEYPGVGVSPGKQPYARNSNPDEYLERSP